MKLIDEWRILLKTPGPSRTAALLWLGTWTTAAVWGWFFVEPTVMRDSQAAREWVNFAIKLFPWLDNIKKLGPGTEKTTFLHATFTLLLAPVGVTYGFMYEKTAAQIARISALSGLLQIWHVAAYVFGVVVLIFLYVQLKDASGGVPHRMDHIFFIGNVTAPLLAPLLTGGIWAAVGGFLGGLSTQINRERKNGN